MKKKMLVLLIGIMSLCSTTGTNLKKENKEITTSLCRVETIQTLNPLFLINY